jgi:hypothetical protein
LLRMILITTANIFNAIWVLNVLLNMLTFLRIFLVLVCLNVTVFYLNLLIILLIMISWWVCWLSSWICFPRLYLWFWKIGSQTNGTSSLNIFATTHFSFVTFNTIGTNLFTWMKV